MKSLNVKEIAVTGLTILLTDQFLDPFISFSEMGRLLKFFAQGFIILAVNDFMLSRQGPHPVALSSTDNS
jgi:uncharacterized membrane protein